MQRADDATGELGESEQMSLNVVCI